MLNRTALHATPRPLLDESFASWLQRICMRHACSMHWLLRYLGCPAAHGQDLDSLLSERVLARIGQFEGEWQYLLVYEHERPKQSRAVVSVARRLAEPSGYSWCPDCFSADPEPYFRRTWCFGLKRCTVHRRGLRETCPNCGKCPNLRGTVWRSATSLAHCQYCGCWLAHAGEQALLEVTSAPAPEKTSPRLAARSRFVQRFSVVRHVSRSLESDWRVRSAALTRAPTLHIDGDQFKTSDGLGDRFMRWSAQIPRDSECRARLARALRVIRNELRAIRGVSRESVAVTGWRG